MLEWTINISQYSSKRHRCQCLVSLATFDIAKPEATSEGSFHSSGDLTGGGNKVYQCCCANSSLFHPKPTACWKEFVFCSWLPASLLSWPSEDGPVIDQHIPGLYAASWGEQLARLQSGEVGRIGRIGAFWQLWEELGLEKIGLSKCGTSRREKQKFKENIAVGLELHSFMFFGRS